MDGRKLGIYLLGAIILVASGAVFAAGFVHHSADMRVIAEEQYLRGMAEMHNSMAGTALSEREFLEMHEEWGCAYTPF